MRIKLAHIEAMARIRPEGYYEDVINHGVVIGDELELSEDAYLALSVKYGYQAAKRNNLPVVSIDEYKARRGVCSECDHWTGHRCSKCNCNEINLFLITGKCPLNLWQFS